MERSEPTTPYSRLSGPAYHGEFIARYDELRPKPPPELFELLASLAPRHPAELVVDLGAGTGISTVPWSTWAASVVGIEINPEMSRQARRAPNVTYVHAQAHDTGLPDACADLITCAQSFHWMEPEPTIAEIARLLRPGGVFAAYDYDWPPLIKPAVDQAFLAVIQASGVDPDRPEKAAHLEHLRASDRFRVTREVFLHAREVADADRVSRLPYAFGPVARRLNEGFSPEQLGLDTFQKAVERHLDAAANTLWWSYRVRLAITRGR
jgi:ubiquinone/menaquinone biosynthesis C-methylase UbiE